MEESACWGEAASKFSELTARPEEIREVDKAVKVAVEGDHGSTELSASIGRPPAVPISRTSFAKITKNKSTQERYTQPTQTPPKKAEGSG